MNGSDYEIRAELRGFCSIKGVQHEDPLGSPFCRNLFWISIESGDRGRRFRTRSPTLATGSRTQFARSGSWIDALLEQVASLRIALIAASAVVFFRQRPGAGAAARMSYVFETKHGASLATERPRSP